MKYQFEHLTSVQQKYFLNMFEKLEDFLWNTRYTENRSIIFRIEIKLLTDEKNCHVFVGKVSAEVSSLKL